MCTHLYIQLQLKQHYEVRLNKNNKVTGQKTSVKDTLITFQDRIMKTHQLGGWFALCNPLKMKHSQIRTLLTFWRMFPHQDVWLFRSVEVQHDIWGPACVLWTFTLIWKASFSKWCHHRAQGCNCRICKGGDQAEQCCSHPNNTKNVNAKIELLKNKQATGNRSL